MQKEGTPLPEDAQPEEGSDRPADRLLDELAEVLKKLEIDPANEDLIKQRDAVNKSLTEIRPEARSIDFDIDTLRHLVNYLGVASKSVDEEINDYVQKTREDLDARPHDYEFLRRLESKAKMLDTDDPHALAESIITSFREGVRLCRSFAQQVDRTAPEVLVLTELSRLRELAKEMAVVVSTLPGLNNILTIEQLEIVPVAQLQESFGQLSHVVDTLKRIEWTKSAGKEIEKDNADIEKRNERLTAEQRVEADKITHLKEEISHIEIDVWQLLEDLKKRYKEKTPTDLLALSKNADGFLDGLYHLPIPQEVVVRNDYLDFTPEQLQDMLVVLQRYHTELLDYKHQLEKFV